MAFARRLVATTDRAFTGVTSSGRVARLLRLHVVPRLATTTGFEQGTGVLINIVAPEVAARHLSSIG